MDEKEKIIKDELLFQLVVAVNKISNTLDYIAGQFFNEEYHIEYLGNNCDEMEEEILSNKIHKEVKRWKDSQKPLS